MIDIENAKQELIRYVEEQQIENPKVENKLAHILRVAKISKNIAMSLNLDKEQTSLAELIRIAP